MADTVVLQGRRYRNLPGATTADGIEAYVRTTPYGEIHTRPVGPSVSTEENYYFVIRNPTAGTGVAHTADPTAVGATDAVFLLVKNTESSTSGTGKNLYLDYLELNNTAAGTGGTVQQVIVTVDDGTVARYGSAGTANTPIACGPAGTPVAPLTVYHGAIVSVANSAERVVVNRVIRKVIPVAGDVYTFSFNGGGHSTPRANVAIDGTGILVSHHACNPVVCPPGCYLTIQLVRSSQSAAASWEFEAGVFLR
jgi:hypothetical protein